MARHDYDMGIIGGGAAGLTVAAGAARAGAKVLIVESERMLGGDCLHYGCVPSKTLIRTAKIYHLMQNGPKFGLPGVTVQRPDFRQIAARIRSVIDTIQKHDSEERFCGLGAKVEFGRATVYRRSYHQSRRQVIFGPKLGDIDGLIGGHTADRRPQGNTLSHEQGGLFPGGTSGIDGDNRGRAHRGGTGPGLCQVGNEGHRGGVPPANPQCRRLRHDGCGHGHFKG